MSEKVKLTREQMEAVKDIQMHNSKEFILRNYMNNRGWFSVKHMSILKIPFNDLARVLYEPDSYEEALPEYKVGEVIKYKDAEGMAVFGIFVRKQGIYIWAYWGGKGYETKMAENRVERATPEESKAEKVRQAWAKIGRKDGEVRIGDVYVHLNGLIYSIGKEERITKVKELMGLDCIKGFYPSESFISFGEVDE